MVDLIAEFQNQERGQASSPGYAATARLKLVGKLKSGKNSPSGKPSLEQFQTFFTKIPVILP